MTRRLVLLGVSTRALAESPAARDGCVAAVDFFGDRDLEGVVETYALGRDLRLPATAQGLGEAALRLGAERVVYGANLENHPDVVGELERRCEVVGNGAEAVRRVRDWRILREVCRSEGVACAPTLLPGEEGRASRRTDWLVKRARSGGGHGIRSWDGEAIGADHVLQQRLPGVPASIAFAADGVRSVVFAFSEQLVGQREFGGSGYVWCGNVLRGGPPAADDLGAQLAKLAAVLTRRFGLRGVNGADVLVTGAEGECRTAWLIEVNPRYSASMELAQRAWGTDVLALHVAAYGGVLPAGMRDTTRLSYHGKAVVYAQRAVRVPCTDGWLEADRRDVPHEGQYIAAGHPVCTVRASATQRAACLELLREQARAVYGELDGGIAGEQHPRDSAGRSERRRGTMTPSHPAERAAPAMPASAG